MQNDISRITKERDDLHIATNQINNAVTEQEQIVSDKENHIQSLKLTNQDLES